MSTPRSPYIVNHGREGKLGSALNSTVYGNESPNPMSPHFKGGEKWDKGINLSRKKSNGNYSTTKKVRTKEGPILVSVANGEDNTIP